VQKLEISIPKDVSKEELEKEIHPSSMNEILKELGKLDSRIEASAIIKTDGTMLASAISDRISDPLFSTIGINLSMISSDILHGLSAGSLKSISVRGSEGVLDLAPIDLESSSLKDMILILFSNPEVKSGIISVAVSLVKKQIKYYLGLEK
jgi:predicted regulator of Ras-like GTPase activity (Roadblock/LC7/MglB family)